MKDFFLSEMIYEMKINKFVYNKEMKFCYKWRYNLFVMNIILWIFFTALHIWILKVPWNNKH